MEFGSTVQLVRRCGTVGDDAAWEQFALRLGPRLEAFIRRILLAAGVAISRERIEELRQEVYCRLLERDRRLLRRFRGGSEGEVAIYLGRVARSAVIDQLRTLGAAKRGAGLALVSLDATTSAHLVPAAATPNPEQHLLARERREQALARCRRAAGSRASRRTLRILELALLEGWTSREIVAAPVGRGLAHSTIDSLVCRARRRLAREGVRLPRR